MFRQARKCFKNYELKISSLYQAQNILHITKMNNCLTVGKNYEVRISRQGKNDHKMTKISHKGIYDLQLKRFHSFELNLISFHISAKIKIILKQVVLEYPSLKQILIITVYLNQFSHEFLMIFEKQPISNNCKYCYSFID